MRLGFSIRILGRSDLPACTGPYPQRHTDLGIQLAHLRDILHYLHDCGIHMYRMHCGLAPTVVHLDLQAQKAQIEARAFELALVGELARSFDVRLSFHPYSAVVLSSPNEDQVLRSVALLEAQAGMMMAMGLGRESVIALHVGGVYDSPAESMARFVRRYEALSSEVRQRVVLEHDDHRFALSDTLSIHRACGVPLVFDYLHHMVHNPSRIPVDEGLALALATWPQQVQPKIHFSSPRTEMRPLEGAGRVKVPTWTEHSDFANPFEFIALMAASPSTASFDVLLESKARDLSVTKLRQDLRRFAPELAERLG